MMAPSAVSAQAIRAAWMVWLLAAAAGCGPALPSDRAIVDRSWAAFKTRFIEPTGRVVRPEHDADSVSEGQAYTMLRAVWMNDRETFDRVWRWASSHLGRQGRDRASLWAWHWQDGGVSDWNVATDADTDAALALIIAGGRWKDAPTGLPAYHDAARAMLADLRTLVARDADGTNLMLPGAWADQRSDARGLVLNPSYLAPGAYRVFAAFTGSAEWTALADDSYVVLSAVCAGTPPRSVPDWIRWETRAAWAPEGNSARSSWDAIRVPWRVATDLLWFASPPARAWLSTCAEPFVERARHGAPLPVEHELDGRAVGTDDHPLAHAMFAFAASRASDRRLLLDRLRRRLVSRPEGLYFGEVDRYYVNSLAYLPFAAATGHMPRPATQ